MIEVDAEGAFGAPKAPLARIRKMRLDRRPAEPVWGERLGKAHDDRGVWCTEDSDTLVKYIPCCEKTVEKCATEWSASEILSGCRVAPKIFGGLYEHEMPTGQRGFWLTIYVERFPHTLRTWGKLDWTQTRQLFDVVVEMHAKGVYHQDIHADNVVIREAEDGKLDIRLIDFGLAVLRSNIASTIVTYYEQIDWEAFEITAMKKFITTKRKRKSC